MLAHKPQSQGYNKCVHGAEEPKLCLPKGKKSQKAFSESIRKPLKPPPFLSFLIVTQWSEILNIELALVSP